MRKQEFHLANGQSGLTPPSLTAHSEATPYGRVASHSSRIVGPLAISWDLGGCSPVEGLSTRDIIPPENHVGTGDMENAFKRSLNW